MGLRITREEEKRARERYKLVGVHCASCKRIIETELSRVPGVAHATVDPNTGTLTVVLEENADRKAIIEALRRIGYDAVLEKLILHAHGLREGMGRRIEESLRRVPGIVDARVVESTGIIKVEYDPATRSPDDIVTKLREMGVKSEPAKHAARSGKSPLTLLLALAATALYAVGVVLSHPLAIAAGLLAFIPAAVEFFIPAIKAARRGYLIMDTLLSLGTGSALLVTLYGLLVGGPTYPEAIVFITLFVLAGRHVEDRLKRRAEEILQESTSILPEKARVERNGVQTHISAEEVAPGETVIVRAGERLPVDGRVSGGEGEVDESPVTGESTPRKVSEGDLVLAGSTLIRGWLRITALRTGRYRLVERALEAAREAGLYKSRLQELADRAVAVFVPTVLAIAAATMIAHYILGAGVIESLMIGATVLVVACPCALGIAIPAAAAAAVARAHRLGVILKRPDALQPLSKTTTAAFDKTGTLTHGRPRVAAVEILEDDIDALALAAGLEAESMHPIARAIVEYYQNERGRDPPRPEAVDEVPGRGIIGSVNGRSVAVGGEKLLEDLGLNPPPSNTAGYTRVYVVVDGRVKAVIGLEDGVRDDARKAVRLLQEMGVEVYILSGDSREAVSRVARELGIPPGNAMGGLDPLDKEAIVSRLREKGVVAFVGDGVNDGPSLASANVGIAVNESLDVARQAGDIVLAKNDLTLLVKLVRLAKRTSRIMKFNIFWAFAYNSILIPIAAGVLAPAGVTIQPEVAALAMSLSSITVTANSARILRWKI